MAPGATDPNFEDWTFDPAGRVLNHHEIGRAGDPIALLDQAV
jgi:hypothetical protein